MKRLALFLDGTWNDPVDSTNVHTLHEQVSAVGPGGVEQRTKYLAGVGTKWTERVRGGAVGYGLSGIVMKGYDWLVDNYDDGDEIYIFGFSRGAFTARSVAGLVAKCGLRRRGSTTMDTEAIYARYKRGKELPALQDILFRQEHKGYVPTAEEQALIDSSRRVEIMMIGVWDTVGALGVPWTEAPWFGPKDFYFHSTQMSVLYRHAFHAMAIDEHRGAYAPTLWTRFTPDAADRNPSSAIPVERVEQRWFVGAHSNVGGGYTDDTLCRFPLAWLQRKAAGLGLAFDTTFAPTDADFDIEPVDSYAKFMRGLYRVIRFGRRFYRPIGADERVVRNGRSMPINEFIDASVFRRCQAKPEYRPDNLVEWAKRRGVDLTKAVPADGVSAT
ncbi:MAG TPA: DUF2235 domain-containing protein [Tahibacter sp.]|uniref:DUF2235 domain-containing protein n=1 Tax=Tahibacter sp. TaxID=2056211 RepID=UPI002C0577A0|nr:DUF2235 domain-containing protein [Tahibacter sp.]HSX58930.1 DUF2235 domain-containing protein [Tahibacter sp.]